MEAFTAWCSAQGIETRNVEARQTDYAGTGLFLTQDEEVSTPYFVRIPANRLITTDFLLLHPDACAAIDGLVGDDTEQQQQSLAERLDGPHNKLAFRLFLAWLLQHQEKRKNGNNDALPPTIVELGPYIDVLPSLAWMKAHHVLFLDPTNEENSDQLAICRLLEGTSLATSLRAKQMHLEAEWAHLCSIAAAKHEENDKNNKNDASCAWFRNIALDNWLYADALYWSRAVDLDMQGGAADGTSKPRLALIPYFDFANHAPSPTIRWQLNDQGDLLFVRAADTPLLQKDTELCLSYGAKSNQELLFAHGFCLEKNETHSKSVFSARPFLNMDMDDAEAAAKQIWLKQHTDFQARLELHDFDDDSDEKRPRDRALTADGWTRQSIAAMLLIVLQEDDGLRWQWPQNTDNGDKTTKNEQNEADVALFLGDTRLTSLDQLFDLVYADDLAPVFQLRVLVMLMDVLTYHFELIRENDDVQDNFDDDHAHSALVSAIAIYRNEEKTRLAVALRSMIALRDELMQMPIVNDYLLAAAAPEDDDQQE
ncbi:hypothetical protein BC940DRAFT_294916 [Gongronella butleri]|nr:hypothetical protein BC940DRAFT_294916 [Gongronella butleri]